MNQIYDATEPKQVKTKMEKKYQSLCYIVELLDQASLGARWYSWAFQLLESIYLLYSLSLRHSIFYNMQLKHLEICSYILALFARRVKFSIILRISVTP